jgi:hypothetical protein
MATGVFVWNVLRLPRLFPRLAFRIEHPAPRHGGAASVPAEANAEAS